MHRDRALNKKCCHVIATAGMFKHRKARYHKICKTKWYNEFVNVLTTAFTNQRCCTNHCIVVELPNLIGKTRSTTIFHFCTSLTYAPLHLKIVRQRKNWQHVLNKFTLLIKISRTLRKTRFCFQCGLEGRNIHKFEYVSETVYSSYMSMYFHYNTTIC